MKKYLLLLLLILLSSCSIKESVDDNIIQVSPEIPFELKVGKTAEIEGHQFTFKEVSSDSRCPANALCIWEGEATIVLVSLDDEDNIGYAYLSTNSTEAFVPLFPQTNIQERCKLDVCTSVSPEYNLGYLISLNSLLPERDVDVEIQQSDYIATFTIYLGM